MLHGRFTRISKEHVEVTDQKTEIVEEETWQCPGWDRKLAKQPFS
jgi:hypothetical protein